MFSAVLPVSADKCILPILPSCTSALCLLAGSSVELSAKSVTDPGGGSGGGGPDPPSLTEFFFYRLFDSKVLASTGSPTQLVDLSFDGEPLSGIRSLVLPPLR